MITIIIFILHFLKALPIQTIVLSLYIHTGGGAKLQNPGQTDGIIATGQWTIWWLVETEATSLVQVVRIDTVLPYKIHAMGSYCRKHCPQWPPVQSVS